MADGVDMEDMEDMEDIDAQVGAMVVVMDMEAMVVETTGAEVGDDRSKNTVQSKQINKMLETQ